MKLQRSVVALLVLAFSFGAYGQSERDRSSIDAFVARKAAQSQARLQALSHLGRDTNYASLLRCVRQSHLAPLGYPSADIVQQEALLSTFQKDVVLTALSSGAALGQCGSPITLNTLESAARTLRGDSSPADLVQLSDFVVLAVASPSQAAIDHDGFRSSVGFVVTEALKGDMRKGTKFVIRQMSGKDPDGSQVRLSNEITPTLGTKYLVIGSRSDYNVLAAEHANRNPVSRGSTPIAVAHLLVDPDSGEADNIRLAASPL